MVMQDSTKPYLSNEHLICAKVLIVHPVWKHICRRKADVLSHQPACQLVGLVNLLNPLRAQGEVEPWNGMPVARAVSASGSGDVEHFEDIALEVVVPNDCPYGRTPTVSEVCVCLLGGVALDS